ncbi:MAG: glycosyltransferase family 39 protein [Deltaproteobacteria bacterium]|nr:glycosyltransferase family 39 protein [Deltaproteobacteria bacterium]
MPDKIVDMEPGASSGAMGGQPVLTSTSSPVSTKGRSGEMAVITGPVVIFLLWAGFVVAFIGSRGLWNPDEPRYLQVAWEMAVSKHFFVPTFNGLIYAQKPPLLFWLAIAFSHVIPFEYTTQAVSAMSGLGTLFLTYGIGSRLSGRRAGLCAALVLMSAGLYAWMIHTGNIDTLLTFFTTLSIYFYIRYADKGGLAWWYAACISTGMSILAKGPVGLIVFLVFVFSVKAVDRKNPVKLPASSLLFGMGMALVPVLLWLVPACITGGAAYTKMILFTQNVGRAVSSFAHRRPWYYYITQLPALFLPWSILIIMGIPRIFRSIREKNRDVLIYLAWFLSVFICFSLISGKRGRYLLPLFPALSLLVAHVADKWGREGKQSVSLVIMSGISGLVILILALFPVVALLFAKKHWVLSLFQIDFFAPPLLMMYGFCVAGGACLWLARQYRQERRAVFSTQAIALSVLFIMGAAHVYYVPVIDGVKSVKKASAMVKSLIPTGGHVAFFHSRYNNGWNFYLQKPHIEVVSAGELSAAARPWDVVITDKRYVNDLKALPGYRSAADLRAGGDIFYIFVPKRPPAIDNYPVAH